jgi:formate hydrogenlyase subunit 6/NADH:ubiquinone oxidoreductase subunit I
MHLATAGVCPANEITEYQREKEKKGKKKREEYASYAYVNSG